jgi:hypothetical protein
MRLVGKSGSSAVYIRKKGNVPKRRSKTSERTWVVLLILSDVYLSDRNWLEFVSVLDAAFAPVQGSDISEERKSECLENIEKTRVFLNEIAELDGSRNRSAPLACLELAKKALSHGISSGMMKLALGAAYADFGLI